jgi:hypothetical protein
VIRVKSASCLTTVARINPFIHGNTVNKSVFTTIVRKEKEQLIHYPFSPRWPWSFLSKRVLELQLQWTANSMSSCRVLELQQRLWEGSYNSYNSYNSYRTTDPTDPMDLTNSYGFPRILQTSFCSNCFGIYSGLTSYQLNYHQAIQSILCCVYNHYSYICNFYREQLLLVKRTPSISLAAQVYRISDVNFAYQSCIFLGFASKDLARQLDCSFTCFNSC